jgi:hypothetical protein
MIPSPDSPGFGRGVTILLVERNVELTLGMPIAPM